MSTAVTAHGLTRRFGRRWALRGVDLEIERGVVVALLGANGTGKTTLLRVLSTLLRPTAGVVEVLGRPLATAGDEIRSRAALMTAAGHAYDELTGFENLRFAVRMSGDDVDETRLRSLLAEVDLEAAADIRVGAYSTGMRKRLELARLRLRPLQIVLLDEPFVSLDDEGVARVQSAIESWRADGATVLVASHRIEDATRHADRVIRLDSGRVAGDDA